MDSIEQSEQAPAALATDYLYAVADSLSAFGEFDGFLSALARMVQSDNYLQGEALLPGTAGMPDFELLSSDETVLAVADAEGVYGHLKFTGRADGQLFGAEDLHLMGGLATLLSSLVSQASQFKQKAQAYRVLQFLVNQLPLGVICFDADGERIIQSRMAQRLLAEGGELVLRDQIPSITAKPRERYQAHFEIASRLLYTEGRLLEVDQGPPVIAYVLYDMTGSQEKMCLELERGVYRSASCEAPHTVALLEDRSDPGKLYRELKQRSKGSNFEVRSILAVDAFSCLCAFEGQRFRSVRYLLKHALTAESYPDLRIAMVRPVDFAAMDSPAEKLLEAARAGLRPCVELYRAELLVLDAYAATATSLQLLAGDTCIVRYRDSLAQAESLLGSGRCDGVVVDLDVFNGVELERLRGAVLDAGIKLIYTSCLHPVAARQVYALDVSDILLHKPFDVHLVEELLAVQFELS